VSGQEAQEALSGSVEGAARANIKRLLIVRLGAMGDIIHTLPAANALRQAFPESEIGWVIEEKWAELLCTLPTPRSGARSAQRPLVERLHTVNTGKWRRAPVAMQTWLEIAAAISELRAPEYDVAVDFQGALRSALIARWSQARKIYGPAQPREIVASMFYGHPVVVQGSHVVEQNLSIAEAVTGISSRDAHTIFPKDERADQERSCWLQQRGITDFVLLAPGAGWGAKQWPSERYAEVARCLAAQDLKILVNSGPGEEPLAAAVVTASNGAAEKIPLTLTQLIAFTRRSRLVIGGDTGPIHLAAALKIPVVAIFGPTDPARNGPYATKSIVLRSPSSTTSHSHGAAIEPGLLSISVEEVVAGARRMLGNCRG